MHARKAPGFYSRLSISTYSLNDSELSRILPKAKALILYSGDNAANTDATGTGKETIFNSVARVCYASGSGTSGSAVSISGKYLLTANHVSLSNRYVTFDGTNFYKIDPEFASIKIEEADCKLFKLIEDPNLPDTLFYTQINTELNKDTTQISWGRGRDPNQANQTGNARTWNWGNNSTIQKRWGNESHCIGSITRGIYWLQL